MFTIKGFPTTPGEIPVKNIEKNTIPSFLDYPDITEEKLMSCPTLKKEIKYAQMENAPIKLYCCAY